MRSAPSARTSWPIRTGYPDIRGLRRLAAHRLGIDHHLAALAGISPELYDAAVVDGASRLQKIRYIDLPGIMPTIIIL